jgi:hypothetical protein
MAALATCTVTKLSLQLKEDVYEYSNGLKKGESSYTGKILAFENYKAYVVRDDNKKIYLVDLTELQIVTPV